MVLKSTKILMVRSPSYLENGPLKNIGITGWFYMPYFKPTINFLNYAHTLLSYLATCAISNTVMAKYRESFTI